MSAKKKTEPSELQLKTMEIVRKAIAPQVRLRKTKESYPDSLTVEVDAYPPFSMREEDRANDSLESLLDEAGIPYEDISVGMALRLDGRGNATATSTNIEVILAQPRPPKNPPKKK